MPSATSDEQQELLDSTTSGLDPEAAPPEPVKSRRAFFALGAIAAASLVPERLPAQWNTKTAPARRPARGRAIAPAAAGPAPNTWNTSVTRLVRRTSLGVTMGEAALARQMGYQGYLNYQLNHTRISDDVVQATLAQRWPVLQQTSDQVYAAYSQNLGGLINLMQEAAVYRAAFSRRQLYERMVEFWSDHFSISMRDVGYLKVADDRDVIRKHALGRFPDLLRATTRSPAMLAYLDQNLSRVGRPNQNYARELLELHTLGVDGGYSQDDVAELSRVLTGWTIRGRGEFVFDSTLHDWGAKQVLGMTIPAGSPSMGADGIKEGERVIAMLLNHPSTARFISTKMLKWLLTPTPSETQIRTVSAVYRATGGDIKAMVRAILNEGWLTAAPAKFKRPFHLVVSAVRGTGATVGSTSGLYRNVMALGHGPYIWDTPDGYPDAMEYWSGNVLGRWSFASAFAASTGTALNVDVTTFLKGTPDATVDVIDTMLFAGELPANTRAMLVNYLRGGTYDAARVRETLSLALSSSAFQWY